MRDGRTRFTTSHRLHPIYIEPAHRKRLQSREVSERKQVGDAESLFHAEERRREEAEEEL
ncbi:unnamed protein product [Penicillium manginii]